MGLRVKPARTGDAVVFWNMNPNGTFDKASLNGLLQGVMVGHGSID